MNFSPMQTIPSYTLLKIWNNLPLELKLSTSITTFKNKLMKALFDKYLSVSLVNNDINLLLNLYILTTFGKMHENIFGSIVKLLSMI